MGRGPGPGACRGRGEAGVGGIGSVPAVGGVGAGVGAGGVAEVGLSLAGLRVPWAPRAGVGVWLDAFGRTGLRVALRRGLETGALPTCGDLALGGTCGCPGSCCTWRRRLRAPAWAVCERGTVGGTRRGAAGTMPFLPEAGAARHAVALALVLLLPAVSTGAGSPLRLQPGM